MKDKNLKIENYRFFLGCFRLSAEVVAVFVTLTLGCLTLWAIRLFPLVVLLLDDEVRVPFEDDVFDFFFCFFDFLFLSGRFLLLDL